MRTEFLPSSYNTSTLGVDYATIAAWISAKVKSQDLVAAGKGEILRVTGDHNETISGGIDLDPGTSNSTIFPAIIGDDPTSKPHITITDNSGSTSQAFDMDHYSKVIDITGSVASTTASTLGVVFSSLNESQVVGCIAKDLRTPNVTYCAGVYHQDTPLATIDSAIDITGLWQGGVSGRLGFYGFGTAIFYNCTCTHSSVGVAFYSFGGVVTITNCIGQNSISANFLSQGGGSIVDTTCILTNGGTSFESDGYTPTESLGTGTDLSGTFTTDLNNVAWDTDWQIGAVKYVTPSPAPSGGGLTVVDISDLDISNVDMSPVDITIY